MFPRTSDRGPHSRLSGWKWSSWKGSEDNSTCVSYFYNFFVAKYMTGCDLAEEGFEIVHRLKGQCSIAGKGMAAATALSCGVRSVCLPVGSGNQAIGREGWHSSGLPFFSWALCPSDGVLLIQKGTSCPCESVTWKCSHG